MKNLNNTAKIEEVTKVISNILSGNYGEYYYLECEDFIKDFMKTDRQNRRIINLNNYYDLFYNVVLSVTENDEELNDFINDEYYTIIDIIKKDLLERVEEYKELIA